MALLRPFDPVLANPAGLASHRAIYNLRLIRAKSSATINAASGQLVIEWQDTCEGYTTNQRFYSQFNDNEGHATSSDLWVSSWESRDGNMFRFNLTNSSNGTVTERSRGLARKTGDRGGDIAYEQPKRSREQLPAGTVFPSAHTEELLAAASRGEHTLTKLVFDGGADNGISYVSAFIGKEQTPKPEAVLKSKGGSLTNGRFWPVRLAFYPNKRSDDLPDYEMAFQLYENGVSTGIEFDYGDFTVGADLTSIVSLPGCVKPR